MMTANDTQHAAGVTGDNEGKTLSTLSDLSAKKGLPAPDEDYFTAADGARIRYAHWQASTERRQGSVLYLNGRTEFIEKTVDIYGILCRSGLDVWTIDWRGQGLSTRPLADPEKGHVADYQLYLDDLHRFIEEIAGLYDARAPSREQGKTILLGHSMGGHLGFRYLHDHPGLFDAAALSAPMIDISVNRAPLRWLNSAIVGLGFGEGYALGTSGFRPIHMNPDDPADNGSLDDYRRLIDRYAELSSDAKKRMEIEGMLRDNPALALGGPTAGWLDATFRSINLTWAPGYAESIDTPVLIVGGGRDRVVVKARQEAMAKRLPNGRFHMIDKAAHEILVECDDVRFDFLESVAAFADIRIEQPKIDMGGCIRR